MNKHYTTAHGRASLLLALALLLATIASCAGGASPAYAGNWMEVSCKNPDLSAAPSEGWSSFAAGGGYGSNNSTSCGPGNPMFAILSTDAAVGVGSAETLQYSPPGGSTLIGGQVDVAMFADGHGSSASGTAVAYTPEYAYNGSNVFFQCAAGLQRCAGDSNDYYGVLGIPANRGGNFYLSAGCGGTPGYSCNEGGSFGAWSLVKLWWAHFLLSNSSTPAASGIGGTLLSPAARGTQELTFTASDPGGPGVYAVSAQVDDKTVYSGIPDSNGGKCSAVGNSAGALMFDYSQPCRLSVSVDLPVNTAQVADGQHTLKVTVEDAAQNSSVVYDSAIVTRNAPAASSPPTILAPSQVFVGAALSTHTGTWEAPAAAGKIAYGYQWQDCDAQGNNCQTIAGAQSASYTPTPADIGHTLRVVVNASDNDGLTATPSSPTSIILSAQGTLGAPHGPGTGPGGTGSSGAVVGQGTPNGKSASEAAMIRLGVRRTITRLFSRRAFKLAGRLLDSHGHPIGGSGLDVLQQVIGSGQTQVIAHVQTRTNGSFLAHVPAGPSRVVEVAYRAFSADTNYTAQAKITELVRAGVLLRIAPRQTTSDGTIVLTGQVLGPVPQQGTIVDLLVHYRGRWEPFRTPQTDRYGHFEVEYQFEGGIGRFPFRASVPAGQAGFPFSSGYSKVVDVTTR
ncbi:MAG TPA: hypothetical protein VGY76_12085 [Solirubrobacteraceae bacterium]|nr:hypothetical protein [Solirubrobacteraceae bacterium]